MLPAKHSTLHAYVYTTVSNFSCSIGVSIITSANIYYLTGKH